MKNLPSPEIWFITGTQHLYGEGPLKQVAANSQKIVDELSATKRLPLKLVFKPILTRPETKSKASCAFPPTRRRTGVSSKPSTAFAPWCTLTRATPSRLPKPGAASRASAPRIAIISMAKCQ